ncbi:divalent metal cation transporter, partial [Patescibacteria group bacterium]|nr:divalent metal cation transporter [Patescibacteria group bacterium]
MKKKEKPKEGRFKRFFKIFGPGLITGAADDDPSGIATYAQTGAQFGYGQLWMVLFMYPLMTAVQEASARIGAVTGKGLAAVIKEHYNKHILYTVVFLVVLANVINIGADIGAMASSLRLIVPLPFSTLMLIFVIFILTLEIFTSYKTYAKVLK